LWQYKNAGIRGYLCLLRQEKKITQAELAECVGLRQATVSNFENDPDTTKLRTFFKIMAALNLQVRIQPRGSKDPGSDLEW
jgi:HTH-type transcriptional regulator/antitoxin HipB